METDHFINRGFGWVCRHCHPEEESPDIHAGRARFHSEGEAEESEARLSTVALARWRDATRRTLYCPRCGVEELLNKA
jgi:hypothetical protein